MSSPTDFFLTLLPKNKKPARAFRASGLISAANYFGLATPPQARSHVMMMAMVLAEQCHDVFKVMIYGEMCQAGRATEISVPRFGLFRNSRRNRFRRKSRRYGVFR
jgi:hypothetical protein